MFWPDVIALKEFYHSPLGQISCLAIRKHIRHFWSEAKGDALLGLGFSTPYLLPYMNDAQIITACMPAAQGCIAWPEHAANRTLLVNETELPFADNTVHRVIMVHALENIEQVRQTMDELWRVLSPTGKLLIVVPNRHGIWVRASHTPFSYGRPFSASQLRQLLSEHSFVPMQETSALFFPPSERRTVLRMSRFLESLGHRFIPGFGGVLLMEAEKHLYAPALRSRQQRGCMIYKPATQPVGA